MKAAVCQKIKGVRISVCFYRSGMSLALFVPPGVNIQSVRFKLLPDSKAYEDIDYRQNDIHPGERCVQCYSQLVSDARWERSTHMKTASRKPSRHLSACKSAVVRGAGKKKLKWHYEVEDDDCRVSHESSSSMRGKSRPFPYFHTEARRPKVSLLAVVPWSSACAELWPNFFPRGYAYLTRGRVMLIVP